MDGLAKSPNEIGARVRAYRERAGWGQEDLCDEIKRRGPRGLKRPSAAKLSRIETGLQPVPIDILETLADVTEIPAAELRPDLAAMFGKFAKPSSARRKQRAVA
jgi:transcriptional regulator with XRE-family HTH domain